MRSGPVRKAFESRVKSHVSRYSMQRERIPFVPNSEELGVKRTEDGEDALLVAHEVIMSDVSRKYFRELSSVFRICQSPIERIFLSALILSASARSYSVKLKLDQRAIYSMGGPSFATNEIVISPQHLVGRFRTDFMLAFHCQHARDIPEDEDFENDLYEYKTWSSELIVECDGHDFHERTKEQASADKKRDRILQNCGYKVFRYTGSDINRDPVLAADECLDELWKSSQSDEEDFDPLMGGA